MQRLEDGRSGLGSRMCELAGSAPGRGGAEIEDATGPDAGANTQKLHLAPLALLSQRPNPSALQSRFLAVPPSQKDRTSPAQVAFIHMEHVIASESYSREAGVTRSSDCSDLDGFCGTWLESPWTPRSVSRSGGGPGPARRSRGAAAGPASRAGRPSGSCSPSLCPSSLVDRITNLIGNRLMLAR